MRRTLLSTTAVATLAAALALGSSAASAGSIGYQPFTGTVIDAPATGKWSNIEIEFPSFNAGPGETLQSVMVFENLAVTYQGNAHYTSFSGSTTQTLHASTPLSISGGPSALNGGAVLSLGLTHRMVPFTGTQTSPFTGAATTGTGSTSKSLNDTAEWLASMVGPTVTADLSTPVTNTMIPGLNFEPDPAVTVSIRGSYTYTCTGASCTSMPEPASSLLLGAGLLALGAARRRKGRSGPKPR